MTDLRIGHGYDVHATTEGDGVVLGGVLFVRGRADQIGPGCRRRFAVAERGERKERDRYEQCGKDRDDFS